jgi:ABC-2 type transport system permease protein
MIAAILRAQLLVMRRTFGTGMALGIVGGFFWYGLWTVVAAGAFSYMAATPADKLIRVLSLVMGGVCAYWQLMPLVSATMGSSLDLRKLLAYPIPHARLFHVEMLLRLASGAEMLLVVTATGAGLAVNPGTHGIAAILAALTTLVLFNLLLASGVRSLMERLLARRKLRELIVLCTAALWVLPRFVMMTGFHSTLAGRALTAALAAGLPWGAAAHAALGQLPAAAWPSLAAWTLAAAWFGRMQFERSLRFDSAAAQATPRESSRPSFTDRWFRMPSRFLPDPLGAMVEKELRTLSRAPTFRNLFFMGFTFGLLVWLPMVIGRSSATLHRDSFMSSHFLTIVSVYALTLLGQVTYWNCFAFDRSAAAFWFVTPQRVSTVLIAKNIASQLPVYLEIVILTAISLALRLVTGWGQVAEAFSVVAVCSIYMLAMGNVTSIEYPRGVNPERVAQGGAGGGRFQTLVLIFYPLALLPVALAFLARFAFDSEMVFRATLLIAAVAGAVIYRFTLASAVATADRRREAILQTLSAGEGPMIT